MTAKILEWHGITKQPLEPDKILEAAKGKVNEVLVLGWQEDGELYAASSDGSLDRALYLLEQFKYRMMRGDFL